MVRFILLAFIAIPLLLWKATLAPKANMSQEETSLAVAELVNEPLKLDYDSLVGVGKNKQAEFALAYKRAASKKGKHAVIEESRQWLFSHLTKNVWPSWYGTAWDFNGISNVPQEGQIACGYFVSTTLKHVGFNLNRYRLAQQGATAICKALTPELLRFSDLDSLDSFLEKKAGNHLYVIGLDYHVGFLAEDSSGHVFTHASYFDPVEVTSQRFDESAVLESSEVYVVAPFLDSDALIKDWLLGVQVYPKAR
ncbi:MAG: hypothetical protein AB8F95_14300 [Bacteroidia bacterium]